MRKNNLSNMTVRRVDLARNKALDFHVSGFVKEVGKVKEYGTLKQRKSKEFFGLTYVRWESMRKGQLPQGGPQRETVLYDKIARMQAQVKEGKIDPGSIPERALEGEWLRSEVRLMQSTSCRREEIRKFKDLKDNEKHWALWQKENRRVIGRARKLGHYTDRVTEPSKEFFRLVRKYVTGRGKQTHILVKLIAGVTGISRFLDEFGGRRGFYEWLDAQKVKTLSEDTWRKRKKRRTKKMTPKDFVWEPLLLIIDELIEQGKSSKPRLSALRLLKENILETNRFPTKLIAGYDTDALIGGALGDYIRKTG